jgi:hypothetical protein
LTVASNTFALALPGAPAASSRIDIDLDDIDDIDLDDIDLDDIDDIDIDGDLDSSGNARNSNIPRGCNSLQTKGLRAIANIGSIFCGCCLRVCARARAHTEKLQEIFPMFAIARKASAVNGLRVRAIGQICEHWEHFDSELHVPV